MTIVHEHFQPAAVSGQGTELYFDDRPTVTDIAQQPIDDLLREAYGAKDPEQAVHAIDAISDADHARRLQAYNDIYEAFGTNLPADDARELKEIIRDDAYRLLSRQLPFETVERIGVPSVHFEDAAADELTDFRDVIALAQVWETVDRDVTIAKGFPYLFDKLAQHDTTASEADLFETSFIMSLRNGHSILDNRAAILNKAEDELEKMRLDEQDTKRDDEILAIAAERDKKRLAARAAKLSQRAIDDTLNS